MDFTSAIGFRDESFDAVMMTEVLEHLPYPSIIVREVHRILKKKPGSAYVGSVPLDYHLHRLWKVMRGKRLSGEQTHVHHFSLRELDRLLRFYFEKVEYLPLSGTAARHPKWNLSYNLFVRECFGGIHHARAARGQITSDERHRREREERADQCRRVERTNAVRQAGQIPTSTPEIIATAMVNAHAPSRADRKARPRADALRYGGAPAETIFSSRG